MSEQNENTEHRIREALLAEAGDAPAPSDLWARVEPRLERPATPSVGWQRRWRMAAMGAAAAVVLAVGGAGIALISTGLSSGNEDEAILAFPVNDGPLSRDRSLYLLALSDPDGHARVKLQRRGLHRYTNTGTSSSRGACSNRDACSAGSAWAVGMAAN